MSVTINPQPLIELNKNSWDSPYFQEDVVSDLYTINYERSDASMDALKIEFSHLGPLRFCESDGETPIDAPVYIRNGSGMFRFKVRINYQTLNDQTNNITFRGLVKTTEESQTTTPPTIPDPWYEITFDSHMGAVGVFDHHDNYSNTAEVMVYLQRTTVNNTGDFVATRKIWPDENFIVTAVDRQSDDHVKLVSQVREEASNSTNTRIKLVFENKDLSSWSDSAKFIVKPSPLGKYKDQNGQPLEATVELRMREF